MTSNFSHREDFINHYIDLVRKRQGKQDPWYLHIGVENGHALRLARTLNKHSVDHRPSFEAIRHTTHLMTSDEFFESETKATFSTSYDVIFIDGLHLSDYVWRDFYNSVTKINPGGYIMLDDIIPANSYEQSREPIPGAWTGDAWRAWVGLRLSLPHLESACYNRPSFRGIGIFSIGNNKEEFLKRITPTMPQEYMKMEWDTRDMEQWNLINDR